MFSRQWKGRGFIWDYVSQFLPPTQYGSWWPFPCTSIHVLCSPVKPSQRFFNGFIELKPAGIKTFQMYDPDKIFLSFRWIMCCILRNFFFVRNKIFALYRLGLIEWNRVASKKNCLWWIIFEKCLHVIDWNVTDMVHSDYPFYFIWRMKWLLFTKKGLFSRTLLWGAILVPFFGVYFSVTLDLISKTLQLYVCEGLCKGENQHLLDSNRETISLLPGSFFVWLGQYLLL